jgi:hypothetical protein
LTVHAQTPHELVTSGKYDCEFVLGLPFFGGYGVVIRQLVLLGACYLALLAADTNSGIIEQGLAHEILSSLVPRGTSVPAE